MQTVIGMPSFVLMLVRLQRGGNLFFDYDIVSIWKLIWDMQAESGTIEFIH